MKKLMTLLDGVSYISNQEQQRLAEIFVKAIRHDSRKVQKDEVFVCVAGGTMDGHRYAQSAYDNGCSVFVVEKEVSLPDDAVILKVENSRNAMAKMAYALHDHPQKKLHIIGVTGTKGKTTIANLTMSVLDALGIPTASIGTNGVTFAGETVPTGYTTPDSTELARIFAEVLEKGAKCVVMEVSSLGVKQQRTDELTFEVGVFTNLSPDHIGPKEHPTMEDYVQSKADMFAQSRFALINADDAYASAMIDAAIKAQNEVQTFGLRSKAQLTAYDLKPWQTKNRLGVGFMSNVLGDISYFEISQPGEFSVYNALAVLAISRRMLGACGMAIDEKKIFTALRDAVVTGRIELIPVLPDATVVIDFAHNELSFNSLFATLQAYDYKRLVVIFGSVGGRSELRRVPLGKIAAEYADYCIITSDNPDFEDPMQIIDEIAAAFKDSDTPYIKIADRKEAVEYAIRSHQPGDMIVFAGKGHEKYQLICGVKEPFSEKEIILQTAKEMQTV